MVINENNSQINSFIRGMNSDTAYDQIENNQYVFGQNIRITKNQSLGGYTDYSSLHEGIVTPVPSGLDVVKSSNISSLSGKRILYVGTIDRLGVIITTTGNNNDMDVYRFVLNEETNTLESFENLVHWNNVWTKGAPGQISAVLYKELENVIKLYIATGEHPIISFRVDDQGKDRVENTTIDQLINNRILPQDKIRIKNVISGRLLTSQVQYTYRFYNKYGNTTQLAPLTNKIQVIDPSRAKEIGNAENTETSIGFTLAINIEGYTSSFTGLQVYRLQYVVPGQDAEVALIYDGKIEDSGESTFILHDIGIDPIQTLSMEEFSAMSGIMLIPKTLEQNQEYLFCANVTDDTIIKDISLQADNGRLSTVKAQVVLSQNTEGDIPEVSNIYYKDNYTSLIGQSGGTSTITDYFRQRGIDVENIKASYDDIFTSSLLRSLRRGETYRYGIVYYDKYGRRSDVQPIGDIHVDEIGSDNPTFNISGGRLIAYPIGVKINIPTPSTEADIIGCQIVRRSSSEIYQKTLLQVALARPIRQGLLDVKVDDPAQAENYMKESPYYPSGILTTNDLIIKGTYYSDMIRSNFGPESLYAKSDDYKLFQIFSSEIDFRRNDVLSRLNTSDLQISEKLYIPAVFSKYSSGTKMTVYNGTLPSSINSVAGSGNVYTETVSDGPSILQNDNILNDENVISFLNNVNESLQNITIVPNSTRLLETMTITTYNNGSVSSERTVTLNEVSKSFYIDKNYIDTTAEGVYITFDSVYTERAQFKAITRNIPINTEGDDPDGSFTINKFEVEKLTLENKQSRYWIFDFFDNQNERSQFTNSNVTAVKDVKIADQYSAFSNIIRDEDLDIRSAIEKYRSYTTNIDKYLYNNWVSFGKYGLRAGMDAAPNMADDVREIAELLPHYDVYKNWLDSNDAKLQARNGFIGPGPSCFLLTTKENVGRFPVTNNKFYTSICNITHNVKSDNVEADEFTQYFGFGNYFKLKKNNQGQLVTEDGNTSVIVFDGDIYITPHEFTTLYKTYNFESYDTLQSTQITAYIPLESKVNTCLDYGMNLKNTLSENLLYEPGSIDGVTTQDRPAHQYNMIYSDNDASNDIFTLISTDKDETNEFKQRAYYSDLKTNGEFIDNFLIFKAAAFIDVDSKYGEITNLLTDKNQLYYWQNHAFGKFSVNERSLINDQNGNTIMLGQAGILSRYDYISTKYGMRLYDFCATSTENGIFWVDINNKAVIGFAGNGAGNYSEQTQVQNIVNDKISNDIPKVDYDIQNQELMCKCLTTGQIIFNIKYSLATSVYTRDYDDIAYIKNHIYGLKINGNSLDITKYNYLPYTQQESYLQPLMLQFIVNPSASVTKVFDSQQMVPLKRDAFTSPNHILDNTTMAFETDLVNKTYGNSMEPYTDREGNIIYNVPRYQNEPYGNRIRGKWMKVSINNNEPTHLFTISHLITKFRQSFS